MPRWGVNLLICLAAGQVLVGFWVRTGKTVRRFPEVEGRVTVLRGVLVVFVLAMMLNAFGMVSDTFAVMWMATAEFVPTWRDVLPRQLALVFGTWVLCAVIAGAITRGAFGAEAGDVGVLRGVVSALEAILKRFALPLVGVGTVFGVLGERLVLLVVGVELLLVWIVLRGYLALRLRMTPVGD